MTLQRSASGLVAVFVFITGCAASTASVAGRSSSAPRARVTPHAAATSSAKERPAVTRSDENEPDVELRLNARFVPAPGFVRSAVRVKPHADNRLLRVAVESGNYFRSSTIDLDGAHAARTHFLTWSALPGGVSNLVATVYGVEGERSQQTIGFEVRTLGGSTR
jgi:hypothetical protein